MPHSKSENNFKLTQKILATMLGLAVFVFVGTKMYPLIHGPQISLPTISDGTTLSQALVHVSGVAKYTKNLIIDGTPVALAPDGSFDESLALSPGYNTVTVAAQDKFGKSDSKTYAIVYDQPETTAINVPPFNNQN